MGMHFKWVKPPSHLAKEVDRYGERILIAVHAVAAYVGQQMQDQARGRAPWQDRTGNARSGLFFAVDGFGLRPVVGQVSSGARQSGSDTASVSGDKDRLVIALGHTVYYGKYLELAHGGRYAVVMSTIEGNLGGLERMLHNLLK
jgi:hypothetical protein